MSEELKNNERILQRISVLREHPGYATPFDVTILVELLTACQKELAEAKQEIERLKSLLNPCGDIIRVKNNLCRCCGLVMSDEEKYTHNCNKNPILRS